MATPSQGVTQRRPCWRSSRLATGSRWTHLEPCLRLTPGRNVRLGFCKSVATLNRRCAELSEGKEKVEADLKTANEAAAKGAAVKDQSARISELQTELAASYKQHAESSQQVIAAKEQQAKAEDELVTAKNALAIAERERDEARERGSELEVALEESRAAARGGNVGGRRSCWQGTRPSRMPRRWRLRTRHWLRD